MSQNLEGVYLEQKIFRRMNIETKKIYKNFMCNIMYNNTKYIINNKFCKSN